jgi:5-aminopentanamidase
MTLAICQMDGTMLDIDKNLAEIALHAKSAKDAGADMVVFPECIVQGYNIGAAVFDVAVSDDSAPIEALRSIAKTENIAVVAGFIESVGKVVFNSMIVIGSTGEILAKHRKIHMDPQADGLFTPGDSITMFDYRGLKIGCAICFDIEFPELARMYGSQNVDLIVVPTALMEPADVIAQKVVPVRALENNLFVAYVNRSGTEGSLNYVGQSCISAPSGADLVRASSGPEMLIAHIDLKLRNESKDPYDYSRHRRPDVYSGVVSASPVISESPVL